MQEMKESGSWQNCRQRHYPLSTIYLVFFLFGPLHAPIQQEKGKIDPTGIAFNSPLDILIEIFLSVISCCEHLRCKSTLPSLPFLHIFLTAYVCELDQCIHFGNLLKALLIRYLCFIVRTPTAMSGIKPLMWHRLLTAAAFLPQARSFHLSSSCVSPFPPSSHASKSLLDNAQGGGALAPASCLPPPLISISNTSQIRM